MFKAFFLGMREFRLSMTTGYDKGRDLAHRLTLRRYED